MPQHPSEARYLLALSLVPGIGAVLAKQLISYCGSAEAVLRAKPAQLRKIPGIGERLAASLQAHPLLDQADAQLAMAQADGVRLYAYFDPDYPYRLKQLPDAPLLFFYKGTAPLDAPKMLAIVGTRKATSYGTAAVASLLEGFSEYQGLVVVSGLAYGIDIAAHRKCLELGIPTVAVQANGLGSVYPPQHEPVAQQMLRQGGGMLSEYPFHDKPEAHRFPSRNRIIAGLSDAVVVVEARAKGGALITALLANSYSREVCAIPGDIRRDTSEGCHNLIKRNQAHLATCAADVAYLMDWKPGEAQQAGGQQLSLHLEDPLEQRVCQLLRQGDQHLDLLSLQTDIPLNQLAGLLLQLEFRGIVKALPGKVFALARKIG